jgi:hypothetical protein
VLFLTLARSTGRPVAMPFVWTRAEEPILEKRRRERAESRLAELHFKWLDAVASGNRATAIEAALDWNDLAARAYGQDFLDDLLSDVAHEPANDD